MRLKLFIPIVLLSLIPCIAQTPAPPLLPNPTLTPGDIIPGVTAAQVSKPGYAGSVRDVPESEKEAVYKEYQIGAHPAGAYEIDHLISLELGGSNSIKNLWPESYTTQPWNAHVKDKLENRLHKLVATGKLSLATAQHDISTNWIQAYTKYFGGPPTGK